MRNEYRSIHRKLKQLWNQIEPAMPKEKDHDKILRYLCQAMWDILDSMWILVEKKRGVAAFILSRSIFEYSAATDVLIRHPELINNYIDSGKVTLYDLCEARGEPVAFLAAQRAEYDKIKTRIGKKKWHEGGTIVSLVNKSLYDQVLEEGEMSLYKTFYKEASSFSHGDSYLFLSYVSGDWQLNFNSAELAEWGNIGLSTAYQIIGATLQNVQDVFGMNLAKGFQALIPALKALPNQRKE